MATVRCSATCEGLSLGGSAASGQKALHLEALMTMVKDTAAEGTPMDASYQRTTSTGKMESSGKKKSSGKAESSLYTLESNTIQFQQVSLKPVVSNNIADKKTLQFGPYLLLHTLGEGEFGKVKLAKHRDTEDRVSDRRGRTAHPL